MNLPYFFFLMVRTSGKLVWAAFKFKGIQKDWNKKLVEGHDFPCFFACLFAFFYFFWTVLNWFELAFFD